MLSIGDEGSHIILRHNEPPYRRPVVPDHAEIAKGTPRALLRDAGLAVDDLRLIQDYLGHRDPKHTVRYTHVAGYRFEGLWRA